MFFGRWDKTSEPGGNPDRHREKIQNSIQTAAYGKFCTEQNLWDPGAVRAAMLSTVPPCLSYIQRLNLEPLKILRRHGHNLGVSQSTVWQHYFA